jgi:hypothetical protein
MLTTKLHYRACMSLMLPSSTYLRAIVPRRFSTPFLGGRHLHAHLRNITRPQHAILTLPQCCRGQIRGKKTKSSTNLEDLPQGTIPLDPLPMEEKGPDLPTVLKQARSNMLKFENCVLLTRVGGFYELYFEHADEIGPLLNLRVADKPILPKGTVVSMVAIPPTCVT